MRGNTPPSLNGRARAYEARLMQVRILSGVPWGGHRGADSLCKPIADGFNSLTLHQFASGRFRTVIGASMVRIHGVRQGVKLRPIQHIRRTIPR